MKFNYVKSFGKFKKALLVIFQAIVITGITVFSVQPFSCKLTPTGIEIVGGDYSSPVLQNFLVIDEQNVKIDFSKEIKLTGAVVSPVIPGISSSNDHSSSEKLSPAISAACGEFGELNFNWEYGQDNKSLKFMLDDKTEVGKSYEILGFVEDAMGNSLTFTVPFTGYNGRIPQIIMTEVHTGMAGQLASEKTKNIRRLEYIEFLALTDGNLVGLELCSGSYGEGKKYKFPAVEVKAGETFVLHVRTWGEGCVSEEGSDLNLAFSEYTSGDYRDLWAEDTSKIIGEKTDVLVIRNVLTGKIVDALMYRDEAVEDWSKLKMDYTKDESFYSVYPAGGDIENATVSTGLSGTYALQRADKDRIKSEVGCGIKPEYPVQVDYDSWIIVKPSLPLKS